MRVLACLLLLVTAAAAQAKLVEEVVQLPVTLADAYGKQVTQPVTVTIFSNDDNPRPAPVLVLNHGRASEAQARASLGRARYTDAARFFVQHGFIVAVPTRIGYGVTGGEDIEDTGTCDRKNYPPGYAAAAQQTLAVLAAVRQRPDAAQERAVIAGQSFGGATAVTVAALNPAGVQGAINFAGGGGGNPKTRPQEPCQPEKIERMFRDYGRTARLPMLWIYAENDRYFGPRLPRDWHAAFVEAGGRAELAQFPPYGEDGHGLFTRYPQVWQPKVSSFLESLGFARRGGGTP